MKVNATINFPEVSRQLSRLGSQVYQQAAVRAMNNTVAKAKTAMSREIRSEFNLPASKVRDALRIKRASYSQGVARIEASLESPARHGRAMNVIHFAATQTAEGVTVKIKRVGGRKLIRSAFIANKGRTVFQREGMARLPIKPVQTIDVPQMFNTRRIKEVVLQMVRDEFPRQFEREARYYASKA